MPPKASPKPAAKKTAAPAAKPATKQAAKAAPKPAAKQAAAAKPAAKTAPTTKTTQPKTQTQSSGHGVYVKGLGSANVDTVKALFQPAGAVSQVSLRRNKYALVWFNDAASAKRAIDTFNNKDFQGRQLSVTAAKANPPGDKHADSTTVFVSPIFRQNATRNQIRDLFKDCGKITKLRTYRTNHAFVTFTTAAEAKKAVAEKNGKTFHDKKLLVKLSVRK